MAAAVIAGIPGVTGQQYEPVSSGPHSQIAVKGTGMSSQLHLDVFLLPHKPMGQRAPAGNGEARRPATSVSLISGEQDAVLIDAGLPAEDGGPVVNGIRATGKNLTTIYIAPGHGDHFAGLTTILAAFPTATAVTAAAAVPEAQGHASAGHIQSCTAMFPGQVPGHPAVPAGLDGDVIDLEGHELMVITVGLSDTAPCTIVYISSPEDVIADNAAYDNQPLSGSRSARELADTTMAVPGDPGNPYTLRTAAQDVFERRQRSIVVSAPTTRRVPDVAAARVQAGR